MTYPILQCASLIVTAIAVLSGIGTFYLFTKITSEDDHAGLLASLLVAGITVLAIIGAWYAFSLKIMGI